MPQVRGHEWGSDYVGEWGTRPDLGYDWPHGNNLPKSCWSNK
jgi:hypothetical protein